MTIRVSLAELFILKHVFEDILEDVPCISKETATDNFTITLTKTEKGYKVSVILNEDCNE